MMKQINRLAMILGLLPAVLSAQYTQNFDNAIFPPQGWTIINGGDPITWARSDGFGVIHSHSGSGYVLGMILGGIHNDYAISPAITVTPGVSDKLSFWAANGVDNPVLLDDFSVKISTTTPTSAAFTNILTAGITPPGNVWTQYTYDLSAYTGQTIYIAFYSSSQNKFYLGIDDFEVSGNVLGVSDVSKKVVRIYPNPVQDILHIEGKNKISQVSIYDISGRLKQEEEVISNTAEINVQNLTKGDYLVRIKDNLEERTYKIIKK